jgi:hypothetical protein
LNARFGPFREPRGSVLAGRILLIGMLGMFGMIGGVGAVEAQGSAQAPGSGSDPGAIAERLGDAATRAAARGELLAWIGGLEPERAERWLRLATVLDALPDTLQGAVAGHVLRADAEPGAAGAGAAAPARALVALAGEVGPGAASISWCPWTGGRRTTCGRTGSPTRCWSGGSRPNGS